MLADQEKEVLIMSASERSYGKIERIQPVGGRPCSAAPDGPAPPPVISATTAAGTMPLSGEADRIKNSDDCYSRPGPSIVSRSCARSHSPLRRAMPGSYLIPSLNARHRRNLPREDGQMAQEASRRSGKSRPTVEPKELLDR